MEYRTATHTARLSAAVHERLNTFLEQQRLLYNAALEERIGAYRKAGVSVGLYDQCKSLTEIREDAEFSQYDVTCQRSCLVTLDRAFKAFFCRVKARQQPGFPRFKSQARGCRSFATAQPRLTSQGKGKSLSRKGLGRLRFTGQIAGPVLKARIVKTPRRVVVPRVVARPAPPPPPRPPRGIDGGVAARVSLSDGQRWPPPAVARDRLPVRPQRLAAAPKGSQPRQTRKMPLAKEWHRVRERARALRHEMTAEVVNSQSNCWDVETVDVPGMMRPHTLARSSAEQPGSPCVERLPAKAASAGGWGRKGDPPDTAQAGRRCGTRVPNPLSARLQAGHACGLSIDRDRNAALNILHRGLPVSPPAGGTAPSGTRGAENGRLCDQSI